GVPPALSRPTLDLVLQLARHPQEQVAALLRRRRGTAAAFEGDGEAGGEDADCEVVEVPLRGGDFLGEALLETRGHTNEHSGAIHRRQLIANECYQLVRSCLRTYRMRCTTVTHAVTPSTYIAKGRPPQGASPRPPEMTPPRSAREPRPTSPRSPSASARERV